MTYLLALLLTLAIEVPLVAWIYPGERVRLAIACGVTTTATHLTMHHVLPLVLASSGQVLVIGEAMALIVEAAVYAGVSRTRSVGRALVASAVANAVSYGVGITLLWLVVAPG